MKKEYFFIITLATVSSHGYSISTVQGSFVCEEGTRTEDVYAGILKEAKERLGVGDNATTVTYFSLLPAQL